MPVVHVMTGLPASGKTTAARKLQAESDGRMRRVNLDDLRAMLDIPAPEPRGYAHEQTVLAIQDAAVRAAFRVVASLHDARDLVAGLLADSQA